jgi:TRAP-type mannitol/chloroaromatic compound transport system permease small subunit
VLLVLFYSGPFLAESWRTGEISQAPGGLPLRWLIKGALPLGFALILLAALGRLSRCCALLFAWPRGLPDSGAEGDS